MTTTINPESLTFETPRFYQGAIVSVAYAWAGEGILVRRVFDASDRSSSFEVADLRDEAVDLEAMDLSEGDGVLESLDLVWEAV